jgi:APA family basic amino acid/polyamine antiporter
LAFAENLLPLFAVDMVAEGEAPRLKLLVAGSMIVVLALVNHFGVLLGAVLQNVSTFAKLGALGLIVVGGLSVAGGVQVEPGAATQPDVATTLTWGGIAAAFTGIFWAYEGWYQMPFNAAELKRPERNLPLGLIVGMLILIGTYTAVNAIYLHVVPFDEMRTIHKDDNMAVAVRTVTRIFSPDVAGYLTLLVAISVMGAANPNLLSSPRAFYAMGADGLCPKFLTRISPRWHTPVAAIWVQALCGVVLVVTLRGFHDVTDFVVFASFLFYALTVAAVYRLRRSRPDAERPYRCTGYPWTPALFVLVAIAFVAVMLTTAERQRNALIGLAIIAPGVPVYRWLLRGPA